MTESGSARTRFRRALRTGDPTFVLTTLRDVESASVCEAFAACLVLASRGDRRAGRAADRLVQRAIAEQPATRRLREQLERVLGSFAAGDPGAADRLADILEHAGFRGARRELEQRRSSDRDPRRDL